ncbi:MAG TPA: hypothetical protein VHO48_01580 [Anaerolineaceae bacterium]|nr:hypothetical protein [Anaerolineaceae bacterium]
MEINPVLTPVIRLHDVKKSSRQRCAVILLVAFAVLLVSGWAAIAPAQADTIHQATPEPTQAITPGPTLNPEWVANASQTNGIILSAAVLVLIILGGTLLATRRKPR